MDRKPTLSIIIPVSGDEEAWRDLWSDLVRLPGVERESSIEGMLPGEGGPIEVLMVGPKQPQQLPAAVCFKPSKLGRAHQLNQGAKQARGDLLWFLHADSRLSARAYPALLRSLRRKPHALHYFTLRFLGDGPQLMMLNSIGTFVRSRLLKTPFGDQGFALQRRLFDLVGGFNELADYGEDHLFVWRARQRGIELNAVAASIKTSARKYRRHGWLKTTRNHLKQWTTQARPQRRRLRLIENGETSALAIFVKTPKLSPIKTRLASELGEQSAATFYEAAVGAIRQLALASEELSGGKIQPYWAVAERAGLPHRPDSPGTRYWHGCHALYQGEGGLGQRLFTVYSRLLQHHRAVMLIGADSPQIIPQIILDAQRLLLDRRRFVLGPARDGGFYLFGGSQPVPAALWNSIEYSDQTTAATLEQALHPLGDVVRLETLTDVDIGSDLKQLHIQLERCSLPAQKTLRQVIESISAGG